MRGRRMLAATTAVMALAPAATAAAKGAEVTVMTRNLYLGANIDRPLTATQGKTGLDALVAFGNENRVLRAIVDQTSFPTRSKLLAKEILDRRPDLVGLQEVALWRRGPYDLNAVLTGRPSATQVDYDFLKTLLSDLKGRYRAVRVQQESDVEGPVFQGSDPAADPGAFNARLTMRDVILKRKASKVKVVRTGSRQYKARLDINLSGAVFSFIRGVTWADAKLGAKTFRFINTHLESETSTLALAQAKEAVAGPVKAVKGKKTIIWVCDCNSDPLSSATKPNDIPHKSAYDFLVKTFHDEWLRFAPASKGFTSGLNETVNDADLTGIDHRIDLILGRTAKGKALKVAKAWITGNKARTSTGLWASDHMGVVARLKLP
jgi:endonuclease/exonuclease/phosphatase family metal-dependent hydrolase